MTRERCEQYPDLVRLLHTSTPHLRQVRNKVKNDNGFVTGGNKFENFLPLSEYSTLPHVWEFWNYVRNDRGFVGSSGRSVTLSWLWKTAITSDQACFFCSHCNCLRIGVTWSNFLVPETIQAAKLCTVCNSPMFFLVVLAHTDEQYNNLLNTRELIIVINVRLSNRYFTRFIWQRLPTRTLRS